MQLLRVITIQSNQSRVCNNFTIYLDWHLTFQEFDETTLEVTGSTGFDGGINKTFTTCHTMEKELLQKIKETSFELLTIQKDF